MVKKKLKIVAWIFASVLVVLLVAFLWLNANAGRYAKEYVEQNCYELVGRKVTLSNVDVRLFSGSVRVDSLTVKEKNDKDDFLYFDSLYVQVRLWDLLSHHLNIRHIHLCSADVVVNQRASVFNFSDIIDHFSTPDTTAAEPEADDTTSFIQKISICDIQLKDCNAHYKDLILGSNFNMNRLNIFIPAVYFDEKSTDVGLNLTFDEGGTLKATMAYDVNSSKFDIKANIHQFPIDGVLPYMRSGVRVGSVAGALNVDAHMCGDFNHIMNFDLDGNSSISGLKVTDDKNRLVLSADYTSAELKSLNLNKRLIHLGLVGGRGLKTQFLIDRQGENNFSYFATTPQESLQNKEERQAIRDSVRLAEETAMDSSFVAENKDANLAEDEPMHLIIDSVDFSGFDISILDESLARPFSYSLSNTSLSAFNFSLDGVNNVVVKGNVGKTGSAFIKWKGSVADMKNQNVMVNLTNVDLSEFTPYFAPVFAYSITSGNMSLISQNVIKNGELKGSNLLNVFNCTVDKDTSIHDPEIKAPLKTALYVIKDKNGKISIDLPLYGTIDSPEFSVKKIVLNTLSNFFVKIAQSPFKALEKALGLKSDDINKIEYDPLYPGLQVEVYDKLNQIVQVMKEKPDLTLDFVQNINYADAIAQAAVYEMKSAYYLNIHPEKAGENLDILDNSDIMKMSENEPGFVAFVDSVSNCANCKKLKDKAVAAFSVVAHERVVNMAKKHQNTLVEYLIQTHNVDAGKIKIDLLPFDSTKVYKGPSVINVDILSE